MQGDAGETSVGSTSTLRRHRRLAVLGPVQQLRAGHLARRLLQLALGLALYGLTLAMMIRSTLGNASWDVLHQGLAGRLHLSIGTLVIAVSLVVLLLWVPLRERPGIGTLANALLVGVAADAALALIPAPSQLWLRVSLLLLGVAGNALATALYIGSQFGPGPRDGLMTGLHRRTGISVRLVRTGIEVSVVAFGWLLGGVLGLGTLLYAVAIGPLVQVLLPLCIVELPGYQAPDGDELSYPESGTPRA